VVVRYGALPDWIGSGSGYGSGYGDGYGYGYGYGSGDGDGYGYGYGSYWSRLIADRVPHADAMLCLWRSTAKATPANGGHAAPVAPGTIQETAGPLSLCQPGTLHGTLRPEQWKGERLWIVALHGKVVGNDEKMGALKREIVCEIT